MAIFVEKACGARQGRDRVHAASATSAPVPDEACRFRQDPARLALRQITFRVFGKQPCRPPGTPRLAEDGARKPATIGSRSWLWRRPGSGGRGSTRPARSLTGVGASALPRVETGKGDLRLRTLARGGAAGGASRAPAGGRRGGSPSMAPTRGPSCKRCGRRAGRGPGSAPLPLPRSGGPASPRRVENGRVKTESLRLACAIGIVTAREVAARPGGKGAPGVAAPRLACAVGIAAAGEVADRPRGVLMGREATARAGETGLRLGGRLRSGGPARRGGPERPPSRQSRAIRSAFFPNTLTTRRSRLVGYRSRRSRGAPSAGP